MEQHGVAIYYCMGLNECVMVHMYMSHVTHVNQSWHTHEQVMSHTCMKRTDGWLTSHACRRSVTCSTATRDSIVMSHVTHVNEPCYTCEWVIHTHEWVMNESCRTHAGMVSRSSTSLRSSIVWEGFKESCHTCNWAFPHTRMSHDTYTWMSHECVVNKSCRAHAGMVSRSSTASRDSIAPLVKEWFGDVVDKVRTTEGREATFTGVCLCMSFPFSLPLSLSSNPHHFSGGDNGQTPNVVGLLCKRRACLDSWVSFAKECIHPRSVFKTSMGWRQWVGWHVLGLFGRRRV